MTRDLREDMSDSMDSLRLQAEASVNNLNATKEKAFDDMRENEKKNLRFLTSRIDEKMSVLKRENDRMLQAQAAGVVEAESRMQQELKAEFERIKDYKEQLATLTTANKDEAAGGTGIDSATVQVIRTSLNDIKGEWKR